MDRDQEIAAVAAFAGLKAQEVYRLALMIESAARGVPFGASIVGAKLDFDDPGLANFSSPYNIQAPVMDVIFCRIVSLPLSRSSCCSPHTGNGIVRFVGFISVFRLWY